MDNQLKKEIEQLKKDIKALNDEFYRNNFSAVQDFPKYIRFTNRMRAPVVSALPSTCEVGELCVFGGKLYVASAANTWTICGTQS